MNKNLSHIEIGPIKGVVLLGGGKLMVRAAESLVDLKVPLKVLTSPRYLTENIGEKPLQAILQELNVNFLSAETLYSNEVSDFLTGSSKYIFISVGAPWIIKQDFRNQHSDFPILNLHGTRLPQNRGGGGFSWQILMGNRFGYFNLHILDEGIDTGPLILSEEFVYPSSAKTPLDFSSIYIDFCVNRLVDFIVDLKSRPCILNMIHQVEYLSTYWPRLSTEINGYLDWSMDILSIERFICAFDVPYRGAASFIASKKVHIRNVTSDFSDGLFHPFQYGLIIRKGANWVCVAANGGTLIIQDLTDCEGNSLISEVKVGDRIYTPAQYLEGAFNRIEIGPNGIKLSERFGRDESRE